LRSLWIWLEDRNETYALKNPWKKIPLQKVDAKRVLTFSDEQRELIFNHLQQTGEDWLYIVCQLIFKTFIRPGREMAHLKIADIDIGEHKIWIPAAISKNKKTQAVPLMRSVADFFKQKKIYAYPVDWYIFGKNGPSKVPVTLDYWSKRFTRILKQYNTSAGKTIFFPGQTIYILKHTGNKLYHLNGMALKEQMMLNRHHSIEETDTYLTGFDSFNPDDLEKYHRL
jgi:integrase